MKREEDERKTIEYTKEKRVEEKSGEVIHTFGTKDKSHGTNGI